MGFVSRPDHHVVVLPGLEVLVDELLRLVLDVAAQDHLVEPFLVLLLKGDLLDTNLSPGEATDRVLLESLDLRLVGEISGVARVNAYVDWPDMLRAGKLLDAPDVCLR